MNINKEKKKREVKEENPEVRKRWTSLYNKYKRKREVDEEVGDFKVCKRRSASGYFQYLCELLANDDKTLYKIYKENLFIFARRQTKKRS
jgi:hypothetical protein